MLNKSGHSRHSCSWSGRERFQPPTVEYDVSCGLVIYSFFILSYVLFIPNLLRVFIMKGCWILSSAFFVCIYWCDHMNLFFILLMWYITFIRLCIFNSCTSWINSIWSYCIMFLSCYWNWFVITLLRISEPYFSGIIEAI